MKFLKIVKIWMLLSMIFEIANLIKNIHVLFLTEMNRKILKMNFNVIMKQKRKVSAYNKTK